MNTFLVSTRHWRSLLVLLACTLAIAAPAQADPAGRIGRIAWLSGNVQLDNKSTGESFSAPLNQPLTSGDILTTNANTRTEIQIGSMTLRLDGGSRLEFDRINDEQVAVFLAAGRAIAKLSSPESLREFTLDTRNARFSANETGVYRFDVAVNGSSATAYIGSLHMEGTNQTLDIRSGQRAQLWDDGQTPYQISSAFNDNFSQWSAARDQQLARYGNTYSRYVSPEMTGAEDLDAYGSWSQIPEYGAVWYPRTVAADWAPYRTGQWVWVAPWGWSWVDNEPWGFAPFHYGRWVNHRGRWGWVPGVRVARPVYAPAMVAWVGTPGFGLSLSIGRAPTVGWFPLGPREVYVPSYRSSENHVRNINITHVSRITNVTNIVNNPQTVVQQTRYMHRNTPRAMTVVPAEVVTQHRPVAPANIAYSEHRGLRGQPLQAGAPIAAPRNEPRSNESTNRSGRNERLQPDAGTRIMSTTDAPTSTAQPEQRQPVNRDFSRRERTPTAPTRSEITEPRVQERPSPRVESITPRPQRDPRAEITPQTAPMATPRNERPIIDTPRPTPQARPEAVEARTPERIPERVQERPQRRVEPIAMPPQRELRSEPMPPQRQATPVSAPVREMRIEAPAPAMRETRREAPAPREFSRAPEPRVEARPQRQEERQHPAQNERPKERNKRDEGDKR